MWLLLAVFRWEVGTDSLLGLFPLAAAAPAVIGACAWARRLWLGVPLLLLVLLAGCLVVHLMLGGAGLSELLQFAITAWILILAPAAAAAWFLTMAEERLRP